MFHLSLYIYIKLPIDIVDFCFYSYSWGYRKVFEQYGTYVRQDLPSLLLEGEVYPPSDTARLMSNVLFFARLVLMGIILGGPDVLRYIGINQPPQFLQWMFDNKVCIYKSNLTSIVWVLSSGGGGGGSFPLNFPASLQTYKLPHLMLHAVNLILLLIASLAIWNSKFSGENPQTTPLVYLPLVWASPQTYIPR